MYLVSFIAAGYDYVLFGLGLIIRLNVAPVVTIDKTSSTSIRLDYRNGWQIERFLNATNRHKMQTHLQHPGIMTPPNSAAGKYPSRGSFHIITRASEYVS